MTIKLKPDQERVIGQAIQAGLIESAEDVLDAGLEALRRRLEAGAAFAGPNNAEQWVLEFRAWVRSHSTLSPLLSDEAIDRESIYGERGL